ncbi:MAG: tetratricopeptide repeat protein [Kiritimatiellales bacterium]|nr:tetratricopeptide repeat protein [Kiritimatiellales bacterium]
MERLFNIVTWVALTIILSFGLSGCAGESVDILLKKGGAAAAAGQWSRSLELSRNALNQDPDNRTALLLNALSLHMRQQTGDAVDVLERATREAPDDFVTLYFYGWMLWEQEEYAEALTPLRKAYDLNKQHPDLLVLLSRCCLQQNLPEGIRYLQALRRFRDYRDRPEVYNAIALLWFGQRDYKQAADYFQIAREKEPHNPVMLQNLAVLHDQYLQNPNAARRYYSYCLSQSQKIGDTERTRKILRRLRQLARQ